VHFQEVAVPANLLPWVGCAILSIVVLSMLDRPIYQYSEVDRILGVASGTARRWINGYARAGHLYEPILRREHTETEWVTWGEFVEARILAEYRDNKIPTIRLRAAVEDLREIFDLPYPLASLRPYLEYKTNEFVVERSPTAPADDDAEHAMMRLRDRQLLIGDRRSWDVIHRATLAVDETGERVVAELEPDREFSGIVVNPGRHGGEPTFAGRRVSIAVIAGMAAAGERHEDLAASYGLSLADIDSAIRFAETHKLAA
jgi:uncharacterized protein (DUF433 family)